MTQRQLRRSSSRTLSPSGEENFVQNPIVDAFRRSRFTTLLQPCFSGHCRTVCVVSLAANEGRGPPGGAASSSSREATLDAFHLARVLSSLRLGDMVLPREPICSTWAERGKRLKAQMADLNVRLRTATPEAAVAVRRGRLSSKAGSRAIFEISAYLRYLVELVEETRHRGLEPSGGGRVNKTIFIVDLAAREEFLARLGVAEPEPGTPFLQGVAADFPPPSYHLGGGELQLRRSFSTPLIYPICHQQTAIGCDGRVEVQVELPCKPKKPVLTPLLGFPAQSSGPVALVKRGETNEWVLERTAHHVPISVDGHPLEHSVVLKDGSVIVLGLARALIFRAGARTPWGPRSRSEYSLPSAPGLLELPFSEFDEASALAAALGRRAMCSLMGEAIVVLRAEKPDGSHSTAMWSLSGRELVGYTGNRDRFQTARFHVGSIVGSAQSMSHCRICLDRYS